MKGVWAPQWLIRGCSFLLLCGCSYLGSVLFDMEQSPQALLEAALQLAGLSEDQAQGARLYEELTPTDLIDIFESEGKYNAPDRCFSILMFTAHCPLLRRRCA